MIKNRIRIYEKFIEELEEYIKWNKNNKICANVISTILRKINNLKELLDE